MSEMSSVYLIFSQGFAFMTMAAYLGGACICAAHRRLSPMLTLAACGFVGMFVASAIARMAPTVLRSNQEVVFLLYLVSSLLDSLSTIVLVFGLGTSLADIRRQLILSKEPTDDLA
jgi:energy-converting hydrogenase Eha subunit C